MTINNSILTALYFGVGLFLFLYLLLSLRFKAFKKSRINLLKYLKEGIQKNYQDFWEQEELEKWFKNTEEFAKKKTEKRKYIVYMLIFLISLHVFAIAMITGELFSQKYSNPLSGNLIVLPFIILSLFILSVLGTLRVGKHPDREGRIQDKFKYCIYFIFPKIKRTLSIFTHELMPEIYGDPRMLESLYYLKKKKNIKIKICYYNPPDMSDEDKKRVDEEIFARYEKKGLSEIFLELNEQVPHQHFIVGDNSIVRIEKNHPPSSELHEDQYRFPNDTYLLNPVLAIELKSFLKRI